MESDFPTTRWSLVISAALEPGSAPREAMARLCEAYWFPLYAFVRRRGSAREDAQDLVQQFFVQLIETRFIDAAQPAAGRFRSFLLHAMKQFLIDQKRREVALKRGGGAVPVPIDIEYAEGRYGGATAGLHPPEREYERQWALTVFDRAFAALEADAARRGRERQFRRLSPYLTDGSPQPSYREVAAELGTSEGAIRVAVLRLRRRFGRKLREIVADTVADRKAIDDEIRRLAAALSP